jgi:hypothetical protein
MNMATGIPSTVEISVTPLFAITFFSIEVILSIVSQLINHLHYLIQHTQVLHQHRADLHGNRMKETVYSVPLLTEVSQCRPPSIPWHMSSNLVRE